MDRFDVKDVLNEDGQTVQFLTKGKGEKKENVKELTDDANVLIVCQQYKYYKSKKHVGRDIFKRKITWYVNLIRDMWHVIPPSCPFFSQDCKRYWESLPERHCCPRIHGNAGRANSTWQ